MKMNPKNGNLMIELHSSDLRDEESELLLPEGYQPKSDYETGKILSISSDCVKFADFVDQGKFVVFPSNMLIEVSVDGNIYRFVKENYVIGSYYNEDRE